MDATREILRLSVVFGLLPHELLRFTRSELRLLSWLADCATRES